MSDQELQSITVQMARIETKLDTALTRQDDHEKRMRCLEKKVWQVAGGVVLLAWMAERLVPFLKP